MSGAALKWRISDHRDGERAEFTICGLRVFVGDADGDWSWWTVCKGRSSAALAEGTCHGYDPYHFDVALAEAEAALRSIIANRIAELRDKRASTPDASSANRPAVGDGAGLSRGRIG